MDIPRVWKDPAQGRRASSNPPADTPGVVRP